MRSYIQILTTPTADTPGTTLLLHFDNRRYLIGNIGEGTQRACIQMNIRLLKASKIFLTGSTDWRSAGGLVGMILTLADSVSYAALHAEPRKQRILAQGQAEPQDGSGKLTIFGPPNLNHMLATCRRFVFRKGMPIYAHELKDPPVQRDVNGAWLPTYVDGNVHVWAMSIKPQRFTTSNPTAAGSVSPRKRSYAELNGQEPNHLSSVTDREPKIFAATHGVNQNGGKTEEEKQDRFDQIRRAVVSEMFDSAWKLDALVEMPLSKVEMPAVLFVRNSETKQTERYNGPLPGGDEPVPDISVLVRRPWPGALIESLPPTQPAKEAVSYIIRNHPQRGRFRPDEAKRLGVEAGPKFATLSKGGSVQNSRGETITPEMVLEPGKPGNGVAVVDLPTIEYVEPLVNRAEWQAGDVMLGVGAIVWILGPGVSLSLALRRFMDAMSHLKHVVSSKDHCPNGLALDSVASSTIRLGQIDPVRYPIPRFDNITIPQRTFENLDPSPTEALPASAIAAERGLMIQLEPRLEVQSHEIVPPLDTSSVLEGTAKEVLDLAQEARDEILRDKVQLEAWAAKIPSRDAEIITLGTGSAIPSKYRNVSATLVRVPGRGSYLFDCGENTLGQLQRVFRPDELKVVLQDLRMIWISHMHADHHLGTVAVIKAWYNAVHGSKPSSPPSPLFPKQDTTGDLATRLKQSKHLAIVSDGAMLHWLAEYSQVEDYGYSRIAPLFVSTAMPFKGVRSTLEWQFPHSSFAQLDRAAYPETLGFEDIQAVNVNHCHGAKAVSVTFPDGFKISYSGDCRPSHNFKGIGRDSTVLIHEATFDDELHGDAVAKKHSTTSEALEVGAAMGAKAVVLTHFSQRYQKIPVMETVEDGESDRDSEEEPAVSDEDDDDAAMPDAAVEPAANPPPSAGEPAKPTDAAPPPTPAVVRVRSKDMKVCMAFDYMRVKVGEIAQLEKFTPALLKLLAEPEKEDQIGKVEVTATAAQGQVGEGEGKRKENKKKSKRFN